MQAVKYPVACLFFLLVMPSACAQEESSLKKVNWHAYTQLRFATDFNDYNNFSIRRLKFWIRSGPAFSKHWSFKAQAIFMSIQKEKFFLQDVYGQYNFGKSSIRFGQFIPRYSLQRFQPDYLIPSTERARAVNLLIPDGTLGVRDLGIQYNLTTLKNNLKFNVGLFNGYGIKDYRFNNTGIMATQNLSYRILLKRSSLQFGYSVMYRNAENLNLPGIEPDTVAYSGDELRYNVNAIFKSKIFDIQAEYLWAGLEGITAKGYYVQALLKFNAGNHAYFMYDHYENGYESSLNDPWYIGGYNYLFKRESIMLTFETGFQKMAGGWNNRTVLQFQMFFK